MIPSLLFTLLACGNDVEGACATFVEAKVACIETAYDANETDKAALIAQTEATCADYAGLDDRDTVDLLDCWAGVFIVADCSDPDAYIVANESLASCP